jgi:hypothetical protein
MVGRGGDFADGIIEADAVRARSRHVTTFDQDFARLPGPGRVLLGSDASDIEPRPALIADIADTTAASPFFGT